MVKKGIIMVEKPLVSVVMSVFDTLDDWLVQSIESVLQQTYKNFEFIIVDDCCKESNKDILRKYERKDERIILLKNEKNLGLTKSLNVGLRVAKGNFIARIDADDFAIEDRIERQIKCFEKNKKLVVCGTNAWILNDSQRIPLNVPLNMSKSLKCMLCWKNVFVHPSVMFNADVMRMNNLFYDENFKTAQDYDFWCKLSKFGDVMNLPDRLCVYRTHKDQVSSKLLTLQLCNRNQIILNNLKSLGIVCYGDRVKNFLSIMGYEKVGINSCLVVKELMVLCRKMLAAYGAYSIPSIRTFIWNTFWLIKHRICGKRFRFLSK